MDILNISGPRVSDAMQPESLNNELEPVERVLAPMMISDTIRIDWNIMDRVTISPDARKRYQEWQKKNRKQEKQRE
jgi:hypothetical protein